MKTSEINNLSEGFYNIVVKNHKKKFENSKLKIRFWGCDLITDNGEMYALCPFDSDENVLVFFKFRDKKKAKQCYEITITCNDLEVLK